MPTNTINVSASVGGLSITGVISKTAEGQISHQPDTLAAAHYGTLSTRVSATDGTLTLESGHGLLDGEHIDIFWEDANGDIQVAYDATIGTVAGLDVPFTGASGTALPVVDYVITADKRVEITADFDGDDATMFIAMSTRYGHVEFQDSGTATLAAVGLTANEPWFWAGTGANPLTGNAVTSIFVSNGDKDGTATFKFGAQIDSV